MPSEFWAAIAGAVVGGLFTVALQIVQQSATEATRASDKLDQQRALAYALFYKLLAIVSTFQRVSHHFETMFEKVRPDIEPWQFVEAFSTPHRHVHFTTDEMTMVLVLKGDLFNRLVALDEVHNAFSDNLVLMGQKKEKLDLMFPPIAMNGRIGRIEITPEQRLAAAPTIVVVNDLANQLRRWANDDAVRSRDALMAALAEFNSKLSLKLETEQQELR